MLAQGIFDVGMAQIGEGDDAVRDRTALLAPEAMRSHRPDFQEARMPECDQISRRLLARHSRMRGNCAAVHLSHASLGADWPEHIRAILTRLEIGSDIHTSNFHRDHREAERAGCRLNLTHIPQGDGIAGHGQNR